MSSDTELVLVTGASGFLGSHVVDQLLTHGYRVRAVARPGKIEAVRELFVPRSDCTVVGDVVAIDDIITGDFTDALKGVDAVVHVASPNMGARDTATVLDSAIHGTVNVLKQAIKAGVKKLVMTSSRSALVQPGKAWKVAPYVYTETDWADTTEEEAIQDGSPMFVYIAAKALGERAAWALAEQHPDVDLTTILPPLLFGPFIHDVAPKGEVIAPIGSMTVLHHFLNGDAAPFGMHHPTFIDVRDAARAHVLALRVPPDAKPKRILVSGGWFSWEDAAAHLRAVKPSLDARLPKFTPEMEESQHAPMMLDTSRARDVLGIVEYTPWKTTIEDSINDLVRAESGWDVTKT